MPPLIERTFSGMKLYRHLLQSIVIVLFTRGSILDVRALAEGVYTLRIRHGEGVCFVQFVKCDS